MSSYFTKQRFGSRNVSRNRRFTGGRSSFYFKTTRRAGGRGESIDINKFIRKAVDPAITEVDEAKHVFADFGFSPALSANLEKRNYPKPTPVQDQSIGYIIGGKDIIGLADTGAGKTAAFLLPLIDKVYRNKQEKVLIIAPTRELALQIDNELRAFAQDMRIYSAVCVGGMPIYAQIHSLRRSPNFVIGTPGRLKDLNLRHQIRFEQFKNIVLDEVDRMLDMGFVDEIRNILGQLPSPRQSLFFSATLPPRIKELVQQFLTRPVTVEVKTGETAANVEQDVVRVPNQGSKFQTLHDLLNKDELKKVLIFNETKHGVEKLTDELVRSGFRAESIHGNKRQSQRQRSLTLFREGSVNILVATDVAARGLDIRDITHVINYTVPQSFNDYIHRIGRTGRGASRGKALTFVGA